MPNLSPADPATLTRRRDWTVIDGGAAPQRASCELRWTLESVAARPRRRKRDRSAAAINELRQEVAELRDLCMKSIKQVIALQAAEARKATVSRAAGNELFAQLFGEPDDDVGAPPTFAPGELSTLLGDDE